MTTKKVVSHEEWIEARRQHLAREKELTRLRDQLSQERRALPWEKVEKPYVFDGPKGQESLVDLFPDGAAGWEPQFRYPARRRPSPKGVSR